MLSRAGFGFDTEVIGSSQISESSSSSLLLDPLFVFSSYMSMISNGIKFSVGSNLLKLEVTSVPSCTRVAYSLPSDIIIAGPNLFFLSLRRMHSVLPLRSEIFWFEYEVILEDDFWPCDYHV